MDLLAKANVAKVAKAKVKATFATPLAKAKVKVLCQPFGKGGKGGKGEFSLAQTDMVLPTTWLGSIQLSSWPPSLIPDC